MSVFDRMNLFGWLSTGPQTSSKSEKPLCEHKGRFRVSACNSVGYATCEDCGAEIWLDDALNVYFKKLDAILDKHGIK